MLSFYPLVLFFHSTVGGRFSFTRMFFLKLKKILSGVRLAFHPCSMTVAVLLLWEANPGIS